MLPFNKENYNFTLASIVFIAWYWKTVYISGKIEQTAQDDILNKYRGNFF